MKTKTLKHYLIGRFPTLLQWYRNFQTGRLAGKPAKPTYSQHGEDTMVIELLDGYDLSQGIYIDVGANHPIKLSNTYLLYLQGHHGILIEPNRSLLILSQKVRKRDISLGVGCGDVSSIKKFHSARNHVRSSFVSSYDEKDVEESEFLPVFTLDAIHHSAICEYQFVFFLSVDVEGFDYEVLTGAEEMLSNTLFMCVEANDAESEKKITDLLNGFQFNLVKKVKVNMIFKNTRSNFDRFLKIKHNIALTAV